MEPFAKFKVGQSSSKTPEYVDLDTLPSDPADQKPLSSYNPNQRDEIRRAYLLRGPCQPRDIMFPQTMIGKEKRRFSARWYANHPRWLEYSKKNDSLYCLCCYLFKGYLGDQRDTFVTGGFKDWKKEEKLYKHEGAVNSTHNQCLKKCDDLLNENQSIQAAFKKQDSKQRYEYRLRLKKYDCFNAILDMQIQEFGNRFNEVTSDLLVCLSSLSPCDNFSGFDIPKILKLSKMYPYDFNEIDITRLQVELAIYTHNLKADIPFANLDSLSSLVKLMVQTKKHLSFTLVYRLLKLALVLPVATSTVERCFSAMKYLKSDLRNRIGDENLSDSCICFVEKELPRKVSLDVVLDRFQKMKPRREQL